jgi:hypothetical protein
MEDDLECRRLGRARPAAAGSDEAPRKSAVSRARWRSRIPALRESVRTLDLAERLVWSILSPRIPRPRDEDPRVANVQKAARTCKKCYVAQAAIPPAKHTENQFFR